MFPISDPHTNLRLAQLRAADLRCQAAKHRRVRFGKRRSTCGSD